jgi:hypothetical protein
LKLAAPTAAPAPVAPAAPEADMDFGGEMGGEEAPVEDKPFDDEPFDAGIEADEDADPKKYIEQLTGKLGQSLRKYNDSQGAPDFELEKFAVNSLLSATHTSQMDANDQGDIIKKVKSSGNDDEISDEEPSDDMGDDESSNEPSNDMGGEDDAPINGLEENEDLFLDNPKKCNMFQPGSNDALDENKPCWSGYKQVGMKTKNGKEVPNCVPMNEGSKLVGGALTVKENNSIFGKYKIKQKLQETFNQEKEDDVTNQVAEPEVKPLVAPNKPSVAPSRRNDRFLPRPTVTPDPKAHE